MKTEKVFSVDKFERLIGELLEGAKNIDDPTKASTVAGTAIVCKAFMETLPVMEYVDIVRCGECIFRHERERCWGRHKDWYCADGKRWEGKDHEEG